MYSIPYTRVRQEDKQRLWTAFQKGEDYVATYMYITKIYLFNLLLVMTHNYTEIRQWLTSFNQFRRASHIRH